MWVVKVSPLRLAIRCPFSRRNFVELCERLTLADEKQFEDLWRTLGLSVDWSSTYRLLVSMPVMVAQAAFLA